MKDCNCLQFKNEFQSILDPEFLLRQILNNEVVNYPVQNKE